LLPPRSGTPEGGDAMRHPLKRRLALAALLVARFQADQPADASL
jgi:hypothetical protein